MRIIVCSITFNNADVIPFFLRHYDFADEIAIWDDFSNDGTREILKAHPKVLLRDWPSRTGISEDEFLQHWYDWYPTAGRHGFDWVMIPDSDEFLYAPNPRDVLQQALNDGVEVIQTEGFNLVGNGFPRDDGHSQIYELNPMGVESPVYSKPVILRPTAKVQWVRGKHALELCSPRLSNGPLFKLLHARYFGADYTRAKNAKNYGRCGLLTGDKGAAWSCSPAYDGPDKEHSPQWAEEAKKRAFNVLLA